MNDPTNTPDVRPDDTPRTVATTPTSSTRGTDRTPGIDLHGGHRPCPVYAWCDTIHGPRHADAEPGWHEATADACTIDFGGGLQLPVRLVDVFDDGALEIRLELEHGVADDLSDLHTLATVALEPKHARELAHRLDLVLDGAATHRDDAPIWLARSDTSLAVQRETAWDHRHRLPRPRPNVVHLQLADDQGCTLVDLPVPLTAVPGLVAGLGQLLGYAALSHVADEPRP